MHETRTLGVVLLTGAVLLAGAPSLDASPAPPRDSAAATRPPTSTSGGSPSSVGGSGSTGSVSRTPVARTGGSQAVSRPPSSAAPRHRAGATRPPAGARGGVVRRGEHGGGGGGGGVIFHRPWWGWGNYWSFGFGLGYPWGYFCGPYSRWQCGWWGVLDYGIPPPGYRYRRSQGYEHYEEPGALDLNIKPKRTEVYVDGGLVGSAGQFDGFPDYLWLTPGSHEIVLYQDGFVTQRRVVDIRPAWIIDLRIALQPGEALPPEQVSRPPAEDADTDQAWRQRD